MSTNPNVFDVLAVAPLTERASQYLKDQLKGVEAELKRIDAAEDHYRREMEACPVLRAELLGTRDRYAKKLANQPAPEPQTKVAAPIWPVNAEYEIDMTDACQTCGQQMGWTQKYGFVHEKDGQWTAGGELCTNPLLATTTVMPAVESGGKS